MHDEESRLRAVVRALRDGPPAPPDETFDARVMAAVRALPRHHPRSLWAVVRQPRTVTIHPVRWVAVAAVLVIALAADIARHLRSEAAAPRVGALVVAHPQPSRRVQFVLVAPAARKVSVVGDFNGWDPAHPGYRAQHQGGGVWSVTAPIPLGHHRYSFVVDDSLWMADPTAPRVIDDDFGLPNSAIVVGESTP